jgi:peptidoglycan/xylan/chitin deacetylase (PgdA/CDA1 family)
MTTAPGFPDHYVGGDQPSPQHPSRRPPLPHSHRPGLGRRQFLLGGIGLGAAAAGGGITAWLVAKGLHHGDHRTGSNRVQVGTTSTTESTVPRSTTTQKRAERQPVATNAPLPFHDFAPADGNRVYLTIDDGWTPDRKVLEIMRSERIPVTTFLVVDAAREHLRFWRDFVDAGGRIENHTVAHPDLTKLTAGEAEAEWAGAQNAFANWFGRRPTLGRPPYGALDRKVSIAAANAGLTTLLGWSAVDTDASLETWDHGPLQAGEINLSHWVPGVAQDFETTVAAVHEHHLKASYLPESFPASSRQSHVSTRTSE